MMGQALRFFDGRKISLDRTNVMGIINVDDDSFYAGSRVSTPEAALRRAERMISDGADLIDLGAESTRPGSTGMEEDDELSAVVPAVELIRRSFPLIPISVDTRKAAVATAAIEAGADIINDVSGLLLGEESDRMARAAAKSGAAYILMHTRGTPDVMQSMTGYDDLWGDVMSFFEDGIKKLELAGVERSRIILDPGIGFAKDAEQNLELIANIGRSKRLGLPLLVGASRKAFIGSCTSREGAPLPAEQRLEGTLCVSAVCCMSGVEIVRVHDAAENVRAIEIADAIRRHVH